MEHGAWSMACIAAHLRFTCASHARRRRMPISENRFAPAFARLPRRLKPVTCRLHTVLTKEGPGLTLF